ncbi:hypothetical protein GMOD_00007944 [Pyrenophora seminiperda CCB06]|uniref:Uncharacterized protein n=1 Tax=Pyrenophora seminiperda CCB06 TaxID=1302712 RepID=A0A3M7MFX6_9PLEO|nr:hypothetical protein GMOD_00007944 [Pyrenophora seminiperda CCB06]
MSTELDSMRPWSPRLNAGGSNNTAGSTSSRISTTTERRFHLRLMKHLQRRAASLPLAHRL